MVDVTDSKSVGLIPRVGSSPTTGTKEKSPHEGLFPLAGQTGLEPEGSWQSAGGALQPEAAFAAAKVEPHHRHQSDSAWPGRCLTRKRKQKNRLTNRGFFANITGRLDGSEYPGYAGVAQSVEQLICNQQVGGSSPSTSSNVGASDYNRRWGNSRVAKGDRL